MTLPTFTAALEAGLRLRGVAFARSDLLAFVEAAWPLVEDDPDVGRWMRSETSPSLCNTDAMGIGWRPLCKAASTIGTTPGCWTCGVCVSMIGPC